MTRLPFLHFVPPHISRLRRNARNVPKVEPQMDLTVSRFWSSLVERNSCSLAVICFGPILELELASEESCQLIQLVAALSANHIEVLPIRRWTLVDSVLCSRHNSALDYCVDYHR